MANEVFNKINTRIALRTGDFAYWTTGAGKDIELIKGEVCVCTVAAGDGQAHTAPTVLFKVCDATGKKFADLKWTSALAADVYNWAKEQAFYHTTEEKSSTADGKTYTGNAITKVEWDSTLNGNKGGLKFIKETQFATKAELDAAIAAFGGDLSNITDNDHAYSFNIPASGDHAGKLAVTETHYVNGAVSSTTTNYFDFVTPEELSKILESYYTKSEIDTLLAGYKTKQDAVANKITEADHVLTSLTQDANGNISYEVKKLTPANIGTKTSKEIEDAVAEALAEAKEYADGKPHENTAHTHSAGDGLKKTGDGGISGEVKYDLNLGLTLADGSIVLHDKDDATKVIATLDAAELLEDSYLNDVDIEGNNLKFTWKMDDGSTKTDSVDLTHLVDVYEGTENKYIKVSVDNYKITAELLKVDTDIIVDKAVTEEKLSDEVTTKLNKQWQPIGDYKVEQTAVANKITDAAHVLTSLTQNANGDISYEVKKLTPADIGAQPAGNYKSIQQQKNYDGSATKTVTNVSQNENGEVTVTYSDISFPSGTGDVAVATKNTDGSVTLNGGIKLDGHTLSDDASKSDVTLHKVTTTGSVYDLEQANAGKDSNGQDIFYLVLDCNW